MERNQPKEHDDAKSHTDSSIEKQPEVPAEPTTIPESVGVARIEALYKVFGGSKGKPLWLLYISIALLAYVYSLDSNTTSSFLPFATSAFGAHATIGTIDTACDIIGAVGKPFIAKFADVTSRPRAYVFSVIWVSPALLLFIIDTERFKVHHRLHRDRFITIRWSGVRRHGPVHCRKDWFRFGTKNAQVI